MAKSRGQRRGQQQRLQEKWQRQIASQAQKDANAAKTAERIANREAQAEYVAARAAEAERDTAELEQWTAELQSILVDGLSRSSRIDLAERRLTAAAPPLDLGLLAAPLRAPVWEEFMPPRLGAFAKAFGGDKRYADRVAAAENDFRRALASYQAAEADRQLNIERAQQRHLAQVEHAQAEADADNADLESWRAGVKQRSRVEVERYLDEVLRAVPLPDGYPTEPEVTFSQADEQVFVRFELPTIDVIPTVRAVSYVKTRDELVPKLRPAKDCAQLYRSVVSQISLLVVRDLFDADPQLQQISFNGMVHRTNPATGRREYPCLISLMVEREEFATLELERVSPDKCLQYLKARIFESADITDGVPAFFDFDKTRYAFIEGIDAVAKLDHRKDLMQLSPSDFEHLVRQVFEATPGMEGWTTKPSKDGGVDAVITNRNPIMGGLTVVQAKQYSKSIGVQHVRELAGTMEDTKAGHGILVTTSTFTKDSHELAERLVRIQLIDGPNLIDLIKKNLGLEVVIGRRTTWQDRPMKGAPNT